MIMVKSLSQCIILVTASTPSSNINWSLIFNICCQSYARSLIRSLSHPIYYPKSLDSPHFFKSIIVITQSSDPSISLTTLLHPLHHFPFPFPHSLSRSFQNSPSFLLLLYHYFFIIQFLSNEHVFL